MSFVQDITERESAEDALWRSESHLKVIFGNDNGQGFDTSAKGKGIGLKNIKNRVELYDGIVEIVCPPVQWL